MAIKLSLPTVAKTADLSIETRPVYIEEWIENLGGVQEQIKQLTKRYQKTIQ